MAKLTDLSVELLHMIAACQKPRKWYYTGDPHILDQCDLGSLVLTNRSFYHVFIRILYIHGSKYRLPRSWDMFHRAIATQNFDTLRIADSFQLKPTADGPSSPTSLLSLACEDANRDIIVWLLDRGATLNYIDPQESPDSMEPKGCSFLTKAIEDGNESTAIMLLSLGSDPIFTRGPNVFRSALHYAVLKNMLDLVEYLVRDMGLSINIRDYKGYTPLRYMIRYTKSWDSDTEMIKKLIELGADVNSEARGELPLTSALMRGKYEHASILLAAGSKVKPDRPVRKVKYPLHGLISNKMTPRSSPDKAKEDMLEKLIRAGADLGEAYPQGNSPLKEALMYSTFDDTLMIFNRLKGQDKEASILTRLIDDLSKKMCTVEGWSKKIELLLRHGAKIDVPLRSGETILELAIKDEIYYGDSHMTRVVREIIESTLNKDYIINFMVELCVKYKDDKQIETMHNKEISTIALRISRFISRGGLPESYSSASHIHVRSSMRSIALRMLQFEDGSRTFPLPFLDILKEAAFYHKLHDLLTDVLQQRRSPSAVYYILSRKDDFPKKPPNPKWLHLAVQWNDRAVLERLLEEQPDLDVNDLSVEQVTPIVTALRSGQESAAMMLLEYNADPFYPEKQPVYAGDAHDFIVWEKPGVSAFEIALHRSHEDRLGAVYEDLAWKLWDRCNPRHRPDPRPFVQCVRSCPGCQSSTRVVKFLEDLGTAKLCDL